MYMPKINTKPHIYLWANGIWWCSRKGASYRGWGRTPQQAYDAWLKISKQIF